MASAGDIRLVELSAEPPRPLLILLERADAMSPLVVLMAVLPGLVGLVAVAPDIAAEPSFPLEDFRAPWARWLVSQPWRHVFGDNAWVRVFPSWVTTVVLVWLTWRTGRSLFGPRTGLLASLLVCCHTPVLMFGRVVEPYSLSAILATMALVEFIDHVRQSRKRWSVPQLISAVAVAATILVASPLVWPVIALLLASVVFFSGAPTGIRSETGSRGRASIGDISRGLLSLLAVLVLAGVTVVAWSRWGPGGLERTTLWLAGLDGWNTGWHGVAGFWTRVTELVGWLGLLAGPLVLGVWDLLSWGTKRDARQRRSAGLLLSWATVGLISWMGLSSGYAGRLAEAFVVLPLLVLAARGIVAICDRRCGVAAVVATTLLSGIATSEQSLQRLLDDNATQVLGTVSLLGVASLGLSVAAVLSCRGREPRTRRLLTICVLFLLLTHVVSGLLQLPAETLQ